MGRRKSRSEKPDHKASSDEMGSPARMDAVDRGRIKKRRGMGRFEDLQRDRMLRRRDLVTK